MKYTKTSAYWTKQAKRTEAKRLRALSLRTAGLSMPEIGRRLGCSKQRVLQLLKESR